MKIKTLISVTLSVLALMHSAFAQVKPGDDTGMIIQSRMIDNKPTIKIFPTNPATWFRGMKNGYEISISEYVNDTYTDYRVLEANLKPAAEAAFRSSELPQEYADALRRLVYEEDFAPESQSFNDLAGANEAMGRKFFFYLLLSSYDRSLSEMSGLQFALPQGVSELFKLRIKVNNTPIEIEKNMIRGAFYTALQSPALDVKPGDRKITLSWNHSNFQKKFVAYRIERSEDGEHFESIGSPQIFNESSPAGKLGRVFVEDSLRANYQARWYRLAGYDAFGILSEYTEPVQVMGGDRTAPPAPERFQVNEGNVPGEVNMTWTAEETPDLLGFQVVASASEKGEYQRLHKDLLPPDSRKFNFKFDNQPLLYYRVLAVDTATNASASMLGYLVVYDSIPPAIPVDFQAKTDTNYVVTVKWSKSTSDDVKGYRLYKAFNPSNGFVPVTGRILTDTSFADTLTDDRLEKKVFYQVAALDHHYNHSENSKSIYAPIPDKIAPTAPLLITAVRNEANDVELIWHRSSSADVMRQRVVRRMPQDSTYATVATLSPSDSAFTDTDQDGGGAEYAEYYIVAADSSGNESERSNGKRILYKSDRGDATITLRDVAMEEGKVRLTWQYPGDGAYSALIYRALDEGQFELIGRENEANTYLDARVLEGNEYRYKVGAFDADGNRSPLSEEVSIEVE